MADFEIDQDKLCKHCESSEINNRNRCEGGNCVEAKESFLEEAGLNEIDKDKFSEIKPGDTLYVVEDSSLSQVVVETAAHSKYSVDLKMEGIDDAFECPANDKSSLGEHGSVFIVRAEAVRHFEVVMFELIKRMGKNLAEFDG